jgi:hypothetical protein
MIVIYNFFTLCKYLINNTIGSMNIETIFFENKKDDNKFEPLCECNLCYIFRNITLFLTQPLKCKMIISN